METGDLYDQWAADEAVLGEIGRALFTQRTRITVRIPAGLAAQAVCRWGRDDGGGDLPPESPRQKTTRRRGGALALIGVAIKEHGRPDAHE